MFFPKLTTQSSLSLQLEPPSTKYVKPEMWEVPSQTSAKPIIYLQYTCVRYSFFTTPPLLESLQTWLSSYV